MLRALEDLVLGRGLYSVESTDESNGPGWASGFSPSDFASPQTCHSTASLLAEWG